MKGKRRETERERERRKGRKEKERLKKIVSWRRGRGNGVV